ncbi:MAG: hypothetical protein AAFP96_03190 [Bacteroidota bacterium]
MKNFRNLVFVLLFCFGTTVVAQETYTDTFGGFTMELYDGMKPVLPKQNDAVIALKNKNYTILIQVNEGASDAEKAYYTCVDNLISSGVRDMTQKIGHQKMLVNGKGANMGTYESKFETDGTEVSLIGVAFSVVLEQNSLSIVSIIAPKTYEKALENLEKSLFSIRQPNQELTGKTQSEDWNITLEEIKTRISGDSNTSSPSVSTKSTPVSFGNVSLTLPPSWEEQPKLRSDPENVIGKLGNKSQAVNGMVMGLKGILWNKKTANQVGLEVAKAAFPDGEMKKAEEIILSSKKKANLYKYSGTAVADGQEMEMACITFVQKVGKQFLIYVMTMPNGYTGDIENDMIAIANSAK